MDPESEKEDAINPQNTPSSRKKNERPSSNKKIKKRKKRFRVPPKLLASIWWIITFVTFTIGIIGLVKVILQIYLRGSPDWNYALIINPDHEKIEMAVYSFKGNKRDLNIRHVGNVSVSADFEWRGTTKEIKETFRRAVTIIPWLSRSSSPVIFAGAGNVRMIKKKNERKYKKYMKEIKQLIQNSPLKYFPQSLRTLDDWEEALYGWVALNYLRNYMLKGREPIKSKRNIFTSTMTLGALDLDQTSLHVSYEIPRLLDHISLEDGVKNNTRDITLYGRVYYIYTKTLQCFGSRRIMNMYITYKKRILKSMESEYGWEIKVEGLHCLNERINIHNYSSYNPESGTWKTFSLRGHSYEGHGTRLRESCTNERVTNQVYQDKIWYVFNYYGPSNADLCLNAVKDIVDNCTNYFGSYCPDFNFPKRPYDITFTIFNEFAIYAQLAGLKSGDSKATWDKKRKKVCRNTCLANIMTDFPKMNNPVTDYHYKSLCLMMTFLYYFLDEKLNLTETEWKKLIIMQDVDETKISWYLGYVAHITNALPSISPFYGEISLENLLIEGIIFALILSTSSVTVAFALRNSNVLAVRPLQLPQ